MRIKRIITLICVVAIILSVPMVAYGDTGPKPSVIVNFENMGDELCYGTLLSKIASTGPYTAWDGVEECARYKKNEDSYETLEYEEWKAFVDYKDTDGYYFLQTAWVVSDTKQIAWTYYPPQNFKILLYYPESKRFVISDIYEKYAFDSYYTVDMEDVEIGSVEYDEVHSSNARIKAYRSYDLENEMSALIARIFITVLIEIIIAVFFCYKHGKQLLLLVGVNFGTQILLNILLNVMDKNMGWPEYVPIYILLEIVVFIIEGIIYYRHLDKAGNTQRPKWLPWVYALVANGASFGVGLVLAQWMPGIF